MNFASLLPSPLPSFYHDCDHIAQHAVRAPCRRDKQEGRRRLCYSNIQIVMSMAMHQPSSARFGLRVVSSDRSRLDKLASHSEQQQLCSAYRLPGASVFTGVPGRNVPKLQGSASYVGRGVQDMHCWNKKMSNSCRRLRPCSGALSPDIPNEDSASMGGLRRATLRCCHRPKLYSREICSVEGFIGLMAPCASWIITFKAV